jgi:hypothetical protein
LVGGLWIRNQLESLDEIAAKLTRSPDPIVWKASVSPTRRILNKVPLDSSKTSICHSAFCLRLRKNAADQIAANLGHLHPRCVTVGKIKGAIGRAAERSFRIRK